MITLTAPAKLNLYLHVTGRRADGYHLLDSLVVFMRDLYDTLTIEKTDKPYFQVTGLVPKDFDESDNLVVKAAKALGTHAGIEPNLRCRLEKTIPAGAGLGGGSSDAAAAIKILEQLWGLSLKDEERDGILLSLGADVPACYHAQPCRFEGIGEEISPAPKLPHLSILLVWPDIHMATKDVFAQRTGDFTRERVALPPSFADAKSLAAFLEEHTANDLQQAAEHLSPAILATRAFVEMREGCLLARMSGSGSCIFGLFESRELCGAAQETVHAKFPAWWTHTGVI